MKNKNKTNKIRTMLGTPDNTFSEVTQRNAQEQQVDKEIIEFNSVKSDDIISETLNTQTTIHSLAKEDALSKAIDTNPLLVDHNIYTKGNLFDPYNISMNKGHSSSITPSALDMLNHNRDISYTPYFNPQNRVEGLGYNQTSELLGNKPFITELYKPSYKTALDYLSDKSSILLESIRPSGIRTGLSEYATVALASSQIGNLSENPISRFLPNYETLNTGSSPIDFSRQATLSLSNLTVPSVVSGLTQNIGINFPSYEIDSEIRLKPSSVHFTPQSIQDNIKYSSDLLTSTARLWSSPQELDFATPKYLGELNRKFLVSAAHEQAKLLEATEYTVLAEKALLPITSQNIGIRLGITGDLQDELSKNMFDLSQKYSVLYKSFESDPTSYSLIHPSISKNIPSDYYSAAGLYSVLSVKEEITSQEKHKQKELYSENENNLRKNLKKLNDDLIDMLDGAKGSLYSTKADSTRHFYISLRELFGHTLHLLSPDSELKKWSNDEKDYFNKKPTRAARLRYICRNINNNPLYNYLQLNIKDTIDLIDIMQKGAHNLKSTDTIEQLEAIKNKVESTLNILLEIEFSVNIH